MAKKSRKSKRTTEKGGTNWILIGIIVGLGTVGLFALLFYSIYGNGSGQSSNSNNDLVLTDYCAQNEDRCVRLGSTDAPVKLVEISDFGCPHCRDFHLEKAPTIKEQYVDADNQVEWIFLPYALRDATIPAANAALCAADQEKYFEFSEALFNQPNVEESLTRNGFLTAGAAIGLEIESFTECLVDGTYNNIVRANQQAARDAGVNATPTFFVNGQIIRGNVPLTEFERAFNSAVQGS